NVNLGMNTAKFDHGAKHAVTSLRSLAEGAVFFHESLELLKEGAHLVREFIESFERTGEPIAQMQKLSERLGFATSDLSSLQRGAELAGVDVETLSGSLNKMNVNLSKAARSNETTIFDRLGLDAQKLIKESPFQALGEIADALNS